MADSKAPAKVSTVRVPVPPIPQIETPLPNEKVWEYQQRVQKVLANRGSRYPAFCIEPMPWERQRLHKPMTAEDRFLRKQWLLDQNLSPNEPRSVPASQPMFAARRILRMPWDTAEVMMAKVIGSWPANVIRRCVPKVLTGGAVSLYALYLIYYTPKNWEKHTGVIVYGGKLPKYPGEDHSKMFPDPVKFHTRRFEERTSHFNAKTSAAGQ
ncbi:uncharacterized protein LOC132747696 [Ruditapes philippinarum]|uniref:uncharacterized protein LOC132747696 n=1 Tax=Ruditapes philippinarum TaxID=129788 RepID=UPI00295A913E|nr:uncharacterized protein LOC132747696 [Ruditapes philippinarum]